MSHAIQQFLSEYHAGSATRAYEFLGCQPVDGGFVFRLWAPHAQSVHVVGDFNFWNSEDLPMHKISKGVWEAFSPNAKEGCAYKYLIRHWDGTVVYKADPVGVRACRAPETSSMVCSLQGYKWH